MVNLITQNLNHIISVQLMIMGFENPTVDGGGTKTLIFVVVDRQRSHFKEIRRVARCFLSSGEQSRTKLMQEEQLGQVDERRNGYENEDDTGYGYSGNFGFGNRNSYEGNSGPNVHSFLFLEYYIWLNCSKYNYIYQSETKLS